MNESIKALIKRERVYIRIDFEQTEDGNIATAFLDKDMQDMPLCIGEIMALTAHMQTVLTHAIEEGLKRNGNQTETAH